MKDVIVSIQGGLGYCVAMTSAIEMLKQRCPDLSISVVSNHHDAFFSNPHIDRVLPTGSPYLWDMIKDKEFLEPQPYNDYEFYAEGKNVINVADRLLGGPGGFIMPKLHFAEGEVEAARKFTFDHQKSVVLFQPWGQTGGKAEDPTRRSLKFAFAKEIAEMLIKEGYEVYIVKDKEQGGFAGCKTFENVSFRNIAALCPHVHAVISIDSFLQHAAAATGKRAIVLWGGTTPENVGYPDFHHNILPLTKPKHIPNRIPHGITEPYKYNPDTVNEYPEGTLEKIKEMVKNG